ncbi:MAG: acyl carrier protein [Planctomycetota bacterium]
MSLVDKIFIEEFEVPEEALKPEAKFAEDLDLDSLDGVDLVVALEKAFGCRIAEEDARAMRTLGQIYDYILAARKEH